MKYKVVTVIVDLLDDPPTSARLARTWLIPKGFPPLMGATTSRKLKPLMKVFGTTEIAQIALKIRVLKLRCFLSSQFRV